MEVSEVLGAVDVDEGMFRSTTATPLAEKRAS